MFKFMKSKKGFSLVELMIVVVIMAILVAVAVPIFNSVTGNAREKTCIDNQRQIMTSITNLFMGEGISGTGNSISIEFKKAGIGFATGSTAEGLSTFSGGKITLSDIQNCFKTTPICGDDTQTITAVIAANVGGTATVSTSCSAKKGEEFIHVLDQRS